MSQMRPTDVEADTYAKDFIVNGDQTRAFRAVFPDTTALPATVHSKASTFHKCEKVQKRIKTLRDKLLAQSEEEFGLSVSKIKSMLAQAANLGLEIKNDALGNSIPVSIAGTVSALSEINRMDGNHAAVKHLIGGDPDAEPITTKNIPDDPVAAARAYQQMLEKDGSG